MTTKTPTDTGNTCQYRGCDELATFDVDGVHLCSMDAIYRVGAKRVTRIAPDPQRPRRPSCHFCGLPVGRDGECDECR